LEGYEGIRSVWNKIKEEGTPNAISFAVREDGEEIVKMRLDNDMTVEQCHELVKKYGFGKKVVHTEL